VSLLEFNPTAPYRVNHAFFAGFVGEREIIIS